MMDFVYKVFEVTIRITFVTSCFLVMNAYSSPKVTNLQERYDGFAVYCLQNEMTKLEKSTGRPYAHCEALRWSTKESNQENSEALIYLGACYYDGKGLPENKNKAVDLYREAIKKGSNKAIGMFRFCQLSDPELGLYETEGVFCDSSVFSKYLMLPLDVVIEILPNGTFDVEGVKFSCTEEDLHKLERHIDGMKDLGCLQGVKTIIIILIHSDDQHIPMVRLMDVCANSEEINVYLLSPNVITQRN